MILALLKDEVFLNMHINIKAFARSDKTPTVRIHVYFRPSCLSVNLGMGVLQKRIIWTYL